MTQLKTLIKDNSRFCSQPWVHSVLDLNKDSINPCEKSTEHMGNITTGVPVVWSGPQYTSMRGEFLNNTLPSSCEVCAVPAGVGSYREWKNTRFIVSRVITNADTDTDLNMPRSLTLNLSNISNIAPRVSERGESSLTEQFASNSANLRKYIEVANGPLPITVLQGSFENVSALAISGGEPLMYPHIVQLIDMVVEEAGDKLKQISFKTNMTYRNVELFDKLNTLKNKVSINFDVNIDGHAPVHEYIRHGAVWNDIIDNMLFVSDNYNGINFSVTTQVSILNIGYITETLTAIYNIQKDNRSKIKFIESNFFIEKANHLSPKNLPYNLKQQYLNKITAFDYSAISIPEVASLLNNFKNILKTPPEYPMTSFYEYITAFDEAAGTDYRTLYPELV
jgi:ankyrin repeat protein